MTLLIKTVAARHRPQTCRRKCRSFCRCGHGFDESRLNLTYMLRLKHRDTAQVLIDEAHEICPYSKPTHGNIEVAINLD